MLKYIYILFIFTLFFCKNKTKELPFIGEKMVNKNGEFENFTIQKFKLKTIDNKEFTEENLKSKISLVNFFFTSCPSICPSMMNNLYKYKYLLDKYKDLQFISHTVDPEYDNIDILKIYSQIHDLKHTKWKFVTGEKSELYNSAINNFLSPAGEDQLAEGGFLHSENILLVDKNLHLRGVYNSLDTNDLKNILMDIELLNKE